MGREPLYVIFTQDCEQLRENSRHGGPETWELSERSITGLADYLESQGLRATFFIVAQTAHAHSRLFRELERRGFELGLHIHPQDTGFGFDDYVGGYTLEEQVRLFDLVSDYYAQAIGKRPVTFRGGNFSGNDMTYPALVATGFRQGSCSSPGRLYTQAKAVWQGTDPYPHHAHKANRLYAGDLEFYEVPITCDQKHWRNAYLPGELRIEGGDAATHHRTIQVALDEMIEKKVQPKVIVPFTHNHLEYDDPHAERRRVLEAMVHSIRELAAERGLVVTQATIGSLHALVDAKVGAATGAAS